MTKFKTLVTSDTCRVAGLETTDGQRRELCGRGHIRCLDRGRRG